MSLFSKRYDYSWSYRNIKWFLPRLVTVMINGFFIFQRLIYISYLSKIMSNMFWFWNIKQDRYNIDWKHDHCNWFFNFFTEFQEFRGVKSYKLRENHQYYDQVQGQLHITGKSVCDFMVWTPKDCAIVRITKQLSWESNISVLTDFYFDKFVPYLQQL